ADAELVTLARECLAARPEERPADAAAVARAVAAHAARLQARVREAELDRARAEEQTAAAHARQRLLLGVAGAAPAGGRRGGGAGLGGAVWWSVWLQRAKAEQAVRDALKDTQALADRGFLDGAAAKATQVDELLEHPDLSAAGRAELRAALAELRDRMAESVR